MKRLLVTLALAAGLAIGPMAVPAAAHHTHSPTTLCLLVKPASTQLISAWTSVYSSTGHPLVARCRVRSNINFYLYEGSASYETHHILVPFRRI